jgi:hypothetical protein
LAALYDITIDQGATVSQVWTWYQSDGVTRVPLAGFSAHMQVRPAAGGAVLADFSTSSGAIALGGTAGTITLSIAAAVTAAYPWSGGVYDLHLTDGLGNVTCLLTGQFTINAAVTVG